MRRYVIQNAQNTLYDYTRLGGFNRATKVLISVIQLWGFELRKKALHLLRFGARLTA